MNAEGEPDYFKRAAPIFKK